MKVASELKDVPLKDLMALGGWKDPKTVIQCYQQADHSKLSSIPAVTGRLETGGRVVEDARLESKLVQHETGNSVYTFH